MDLKKRTIGERRAFMEGTMQACTLIRSWMKEGLTAEQALEKQEQFVRMSWELFSDREEDSK